MVDALGNATIETCDALNRPVLLEKKDPRGNIISREEYFYDRSGNRTKRTTYVFQKSRLTKQISASWEYDSMGRVVREIEDEKKITSFTYDERGRIKTRTLPDGTILLHAYDEIDRLSNKSSDGTVTSLFL
jgi:YD repeat-containing protein